MIYAAKRMGLVKYKKTKKKSRKHRRYPELLIPGEKVQIDVKEVSYNCLRGKGLRDGKHFYQWTAIDECTRMRFVYGFEEHTPENSTKFLKMLLKEFPFKIQTVQTDNGREFTYKYQSSEVKSPFEIELNTKLKGHLEWSNNKTMRTLDYKSPMQLLSEKLELKSIN